jgi:hypothetical protein
MNNMFLKFGISLLIILIIYTILPLAVINVLGYFALGWMLYDIVNYAMEYYYD